MNNIHFEKFGSGDEVVHFAHANGFPPQTYKQFLDKLGQNSQIIASHARPLWPGADYRQLKSWRIMADDLIRFMDQEGLRDIIGVGHSMGAVCSAIAAMKRPDLFKKLILIDPVIFSFKRMVAISLFPIAWRKKMIPVAKISVKRKDEWSNSKAVFNSWRKKGVFKNVSDNNLQLLVDGATTENKNGAVTLRYSKEWETQVYCTAPYILNRLIHIEIPVVAIRGEKSDVITKEVWDYWQSKQKNGKFINFEGAGHLIPQEFPDKLASLIETHIIQ